MLEKKSYDRWLCNNTKIRNCIFAWNIMHINDMRNKVIDFPFILIIIGRTSFTTHQICVIFLSNDVRNRACCGLLIVITASLKSTQFSSSMENTFVNIHCSIIDIQMITWQMMKNISFETSLIWFYIINCNVCGFDT